jgi:hypothetical protein
MSGKYRGGLLRSTRSCGACTRRPDHVLHCGRRRRARSAAARPRGGGRLDPLRHRARLHPRRGDSTQDLLDAARTPRRRARDAEARREDLRRQDGDVLNIRFNVRRAEGGSPAAVRHRARHRRRSLPPLRSACHRINGEVPLPRALWRDPQIHGEPPQVTPPAPKRPVLTRASGAQPAGRRPPAAPAVAGRNSVRRTRSRYIFARIRASKGPFQPARTRQRALRGTVPHNVGCHHNDRCWGQSLTTDVVVSRR